MDTRGSMARPRFAALTALTLVTALLAAPAARARDPDPWWGPDKALHFGFSAAFTGLGWATGAALESERPARLGLALGLGLGVGVAKELADLTLDTGHASWRDMTWNVAGVALGLAASFLVDLALGDP